MQDIQEQDRSISGFVPVANPSASVTHIRVSVSHAPGRGYLLGMTPVALEDKSFGRFWTCNLTKCRFHALGDSGRYSQKKIKGYFEAAHCDIQSNTGIAWSMLGGIATAEGVAL